MPRHAKLQEKQAVFGRARSTSPFLSADDPRLAGFSVPEHPNHQPSAAAARANAPTEQERWDRMASP